MSEDKIRFLQKHANLIFAWLIAISMFIVSINQTITLSNIGYESEEHNEMKKLCEESKKEGMGCRVEFGPFVEFEQLEENQAEGKEATHEDEQQSGN